MPKHLVRPRLSRRAIAAGVASALVCFASPLAADRIDNQVAVFSALDKVTARIQRLEIPLNETVQFGALAVTARACYSRPPTEPPKTTSFVEVNETQLDGNTKRIFTGWMFAESPGLNAVEHPVFDLWLTECLKPKGGVAATKPTDPAAARKPATAGAAPAEPEAGLGDATEPRRRVRR
jgi:hypothetical protein